MNQKTKTAWLIEDTRPPRPMYAAVNEYGMWYGEWDTNNPAVVQFANRASAEAVMRAVKRRDDGYAPSGFHHLQEAREHMWVSSEPRHYPPGMGEESRRLHREYNVLVEAQRNGAKNGAEVVRLTDECNAKGIILVPGGENL
jgi:hypothetical protein